MNPSDAQLKITSNKADASQEDSPGTFIRLNAAKLPNPFRAMKCKEVEDNPTSIAEWMQADPERSRAWNRLVHEGLTQLQAGKNVQCRCKFGKHRSATLAEVLYDKFTSENPGVRVELAHLARETPFS